MYVKKYYVSRSFDSMMLPGTMAPEVLFRTGRICGARGGLGGHIHPRAVGRGGSESAITAVSFKPAMGRFG